MNKEKKESRKVLVIVPHEDDEINVAGSVMRNFIRQKNEVYCVFTTNGDYSFWAATRMHEAVRSLTILGVQHILFLGYGDTGNFCKDGHVFYADKEAVTSPGGRKETYGTADFPDYACQKRHRHSPYDRHHFKEDLHDLLLDIQADVIFCVDYDVHADHRACSILFEETLGEILRRPGNAYQPAVFKGFAYCTSFGAPADFYQPNLRSVPCPDDGPDRIIGYSLYEWSKRVRFPVCAECRTMYMRRNILYKALFEHKSQSAALHAVRIINGDTVFWQRRTDSLSYQADVTATSGLADRVRDFKLVDTTDIDTKKAVFHQYVWRPDETDLEKKLTFHWKQEQQIVLIRFFANINDDGRIMKWRICFDSGYSAIYGPMPQHGRAFTISIPQQDVHICTVQILEWSGTAYGLAECEFFAEKMQKTMIQPFLKLKINDDFVYEYILPEKTEQCQLSVYMYPLKQAVTFTVREGPNSSVSDKGLVLFGVSDTVVRIRAAFTTDKTIYDEITLRRVSAGFFRKRSIWQHLEKWGLAWYLKKYRKYIHIRHKYLKKL
jgi:LmbE family N-acetylglucosaminyl deacetylase